MKPALSARECLTVITAVTLTILAYPVALMTAHGHKRSLWPDGVERPGEWLLKSVTTSSHLFDSYYAMAIGQSPAFVGGGRFEGFVILALVGAAGFALSSSNALVAKRDPLSLHGNARFANRRERALMKTGLELGIDPESGRTIRVAVKGHLLSIAPPRSGKTSGLLIPNLLAPERQSWFGPAVVIDPKGECYAATVERRRALGRTVRCLDPKNIVGGTDRWAPLLGMDPNDILYLQRLASALLPPSIENETKFFREAAVAVIVSGFLAAHREGNPTPSRVKELLDDTDLFERVLSEMTDKPTRKTLALLRREPRVRDSILETAVQAFGWCDDPRLAELTNSSTFSLDEIRRGEADLFITLPTEDLEQIAPLIRWLLADLFTTFRRNRPSERVVVFIDEAAVLGGFKEISSSYGELPGYNVSLWTFWQARSQLLDAYGRHKADTMIGTSEMVTICAVSSADPDETEHWSKALGNYTVLETASSQTEARPGHPAQSSTTTTSKPVRLMTAEAIGELPNAKIIILPNSPLYQKHPVLIATTQWNDARFNGIKGHTGSTAST